MKKQIFTLLFSATLISALLISCASTKNAKPVNADDYDSISGSTDESEVSTTRKSKSQIEYEEYQEKNSFEKMFTYGNKGNFISTDDTTVFAKSITGSLKQRKAAILINPNKDEAGFGASYLSNYYILQFDAEARAKLAQAAENYLSDFENKRLDRKNKNTFKKYGSIKIHEDWGTISSSTPSNADGAANLGYEFVKGSPYFTILVYPLHNNYYDVVGDTTNRESMMIKYYFTKAQIKDLINMTSEEAVNKFKTTYVEENSEVIVDSDEYTDQ